MKIGGGIGALMAPSCCVIINVLDGYLFQETPLVNQYGGKKRIKNDSVAVAES